MIAEFETYRKNHPDRVCDIVIKGGVADVQQQSDASDRMLVHGEASNIIQDIEGETVVAKGFVTDYALAEGKVIWGHPPLTPQGLGILPPEYVLGPIVGLRVGDRSLYSMGELYKGNPHSVSVFNIMKGNPGNHGIGWSIEGAAILKNPRDKTRIEKTFLTNLSLYHNVKNLVTWAEVVDAADLCKALIAGFGTINKAMDTVQIQPLMKEDLSPVLVEQVFKGARDAGISDDDAKRLRLCEYFRYDKVLKKAVFRDRSALVQYLVKENGMDIHKALDFVRSFRVNQLKALGGK